MNKILVIVLVFFLMLVFNKRENFVAGNSKELKKIKCENTTNLMSDINMYIKKTCQDKSSTNRMMNNDRLTCRNFIDKKLSVSNENKNWCGEDNKIPEKIFEGEFNGLNKLNHDGVGPTPNSIQGVNSDYPFDLDMIKAKNINLDNKA
jgi:hypothetical protein